MTHPLYLDPGSGSLILQLAIAALATIGIFIGASWSKIKRLFIKRSAKDLDEDN